MYFTLILPAFNEEDCIYRNALAASAKVAEFCDDYEVIVSDDGSTDCTAKEAGRAARVDGHIRVLKGFGHGGKGRAVCVAAALARGKYVAFCDADLDLDPSELSYFLDVMKEEKAGAVVGSKLDPRSHVDAPLMRKLYSLGCGVLMKALFRLPVYDTQTGMKLYRGDALKKAAAMAREPGFGFDAEILCLFRMFGLKIVSVPVDARFVRRGRGRLGIKDALEVLASSLRIFRRIHFSGTYRGRRANSSTARAVRAAAAGQMN